MDPAVRKLVNRLDDHLGRLSSQMEELHESVRQVVVVAEADPEMALTKARKVLESVLRRVWEHFIPNEPIGTRPLEEVLQRLQKNGHLPRKQAAYAIAVKELGNVGTHVHDEKVDKADVVQALSPLISVLEWYFDQDWVEGAGLGETRRPDLAARLRPRSWARRARAGAGPETSVPPPAGRWFRCDTDGDNCRWIVRRVPGHNPPSDRRDRPSIRPGADPGPLAGSRRGRLDERSLEHRQGCLDVSWHATDVLPPGRWKGGGPVPWAVLAEPGCREEVVRQRLHAAGWRSKSSSKGSMSSRANSSESATGSAPATWPRDLSPGGPTRSWTGPAPGEFT